MKSTSSIPSKIDQRVNDTLNEIPVLGEALIDTIEAYNEEREKLKKERKALELEREHLLAKPSLSVTPRPIVPLRRTPTNLPPPIYPKIARISDSGRRPGQGHMASTSDLSFRSDSAPSDPFQDLEPLTGFTELTPYKLTSVSSNPSFDTELYWFMLILYRRKLKKWWPIRYLPTSQTLVSI